MNVGEISMLISLHRTAFNIICNEAFDSFRAGVNSGISAIEWADG
jgi:hypothetical protein